MQNIFGIDLGTTYSCIAVMDEGREVVIDNSNGQLTTPSIVYFDEDGSVLIGEPARQLVKESPARVVQDVKRHMGEPAWRFNVNGESYTAQEISALILKKVVADAELVRGIPIKDVVITCPAYFGSVERAATKQAGELALLNVHQVTSEPAAAAFSYTFGKGDPETLLVYDLGGGTFDVTVIDGASYEVIAVDGDKQLGGRDWDQAIVDYCIGVFEAQTGKSGSVLREDPHTYRGLLIDAEAAKVNLSAGPKGSSLGPKQIIRIRLDTMDTVSVELQRRQFENITAFLLEKTILRTRAVLKQAAEKGCKRIDAILLVGGSTFMPQVESRLIEEFSLPIRRRNPNQIVAMGAALLGYKAMLDNTLKELGGFAFASDGTPLLNGDAHEKLLGQISTIHDADPTLVDALTRRTMTEVAPKSFGIKVIHDNGASFRVDNAILRNEAVPAEAARTYYTFTETDFVSLQAFENRNPKAEYVLLEDCELLGEVIFKFPRSVPKNHPFRLTIQFTADNLLKVEAYDEVTGARVRADFRAKGLLTEVEMKAGIERISSIRAA